MQHRETKQRKLILENVQSRCDHPSAEDIYVSVHEIDDKISRGTVYRNLDYLTESGRVMRLMIGGVGHYDRNTKPHIHLCCSSCGEIRDLQAMYHEEWDREAEKETGYTIYGHSTLFEGCCPSCREKSGGTEESGIEEVRE